MAELRSDQPVITVGQFDSRTPHDPGQGTPDRRPRLLHEKNKSPFQGQQERQRIADNFTVVDHVIPVSLETLTPPEPFDEVARVGGENYDQWVKKVTEACPKEGSRKARETIRKYGADALKKLIGQKRTITPKPIKDCSFIWTDGEPVLFSLPTPAEIKGFNDKTASITSSVLLKIRAAQQAMCEAIARSPQVPEKLRDVARIKALQLRWDAHFMINGFSRRVQEQRQPKRYAHDHLSPYSRNQKTIAFVETVGMGASAAAGLAGAEVLQQQSRYFPLEQTDVGNIGQVDATTVTDALKDNAVYQQALVDKKSVAFAIAGQNGYEPQDMNLDMGWATKPDGTTVVTFLISHNDPQTKQPDTYFFPDGKGGYIQVAVNPQGGFSLWPVAFADGAGFHMVPGVVNTATGEVVGVVSSSMLAGGNAEIIDFGTDVLDVPDGSKNELLGMVATVNADTLNVRDSASTDSQIVAKVHAGDRIFITGVTQDKQWFQIFYEGKLYYVSTQYTDTDPNTIPSTPTPNADAVLISAEMNSPIDQLPAPIVEAPPVAPALELVPADATWESLATNLQEGQAMVFNETAPEVIRGPLTSGVVVNIEGKIIVMGTDISYIPPITGIDVEKFRGFLERSHTTVDANTRVELRDRSKGIDDGDNTLVISGDIELVQPKVETLPNGETIVVKKLFISNLSDAKEGKATSLQGFSIILLGVPLDAHGDAWGATDNRQWTEEAQAFPVEIARQTWNKLYGNIITYDEVVRQGKAGTLTADQLWKLVGSDEATWRTFAEAAQKEANSWLTLGSPSQPIASFPSPQLVSG